MSFEDVEGYNRERETGEFEGLTEDEEDSVHAKVNYVFTCYKYTDESKRLLNGYTNFRFIVYGHEICPKTGRPHLQGYFQLRKKMRITGLHKVFANPMMWYKGAFKGPEVNIRYCSKDNNNVYMRGEYIKERERVDLNVIVKDIKEGLTVDEIVLTNPMMYHQYGRTLERIEDVVNNERRRTIMPKCIWYYGPTGSGKSHRAFEGFEFKTHYNYPDDNGWWDGYKGQKTVIFNDFRGDIPYNVLLKIIDKWDYAVKRRCRRPTPLLAEVVIITSSLHPMDVYKKRNDKDKIEQLLRRITDLSWCGTEQERIDYECKAQEHEEFIIRLGTPRVFSPTFKGL